MAEARGHSRDATLGLSLFGELPYEHVSGDRADGRDLAINIAQLPFDVFDDRDGLPPSILKDETLKLQQLRRFQIERVGRVVDRPAHLHLLAVLGYEEITRRGVPWSRAQPHGEWQ